MQPSSRPLDGPCDWLLQPEEPRLRWHAAVCGLFFFGWWLRKAAQDPQSTPPPNTPQTFGQRDNFQFLFFFFSLLWQQLRWTPEIDLTGFCFKREKKRKKSKCWDNFTFEMCYSRTTAFYRILSWLAAKEWLVYLFFSCVCVCVCVCECECSWDSEKMRDMWRGKGRWIHLNEKKKKKRRRRRRK